MATLITFIFLFIVSIFIYKDAEDRGMCGLGWAICTFLVLIVTLPLYLIVRKPFVNKEK